MPASTVCIKEKQNANKRTANWVWVKMKLMILSFCLNMQMHSSYIVWQWIGYWERLIAPFTLNILGYLKWKYQWWEIIVVLDLTVRHVRQWPIWSFSYQRLTVSRSLRPHSNNLAAITTHTYQQTNQKITWSDTEWCDTSLYPEYSVLLLLLLLLVFIKILTTLP